MVRKINYFQMNRYSSLPNVVDVSRLLEQRMIEEPSTHAINEEILKYRNMALIQAKPIGQPDVELHACRTTPNVEPITSVCIPQTTFKAEPTSPIPCTTVAQLESDVTTTMSDQSESPPTAISTSSLALRELPLEPMLLTEGNTLNERCIQQLKKSDTSNPDKECSQFLKSRKDDDNEFNACTPSFMQTNMLSDMNNNLENYSIQVKLDKGESTHTKNLKRSLDDLFETQPCDEEQINVVDMDQTHTDGRSSNVLAPQQHETDISKNITTLNYFENSPNKYTKSKRTKIDTPKFLDVDTGSTDNEALDLEEMNDSSLDVTEKTESLLNQNDKIPSLEHDWKRSSGSSAQHDLKSNSYDQNNNKTHAILPEIIYMQHGMIGLKYQLKQAKLREVMEQENAHKLQIELMEKEHKTKENAHKLQMELMEKEHALKLEQHKAKMGVILLEMDLLKERQ